jgi:exopolysaccharide biosynthesis protein
MPSYSPSTEIDNGWILITPGLERRDYFPIAENEVTKLTALRVDPTFYTFRVHYQPGAPLTIREWAVVIPEATVFVNANFFDEDGEILGMLTVDGMVYGSPYTDRGGMFAVQNAEPRVRSNTAEPYMGEALEQAIQAFPMLVSNGLQAYINTAEDTFTRRTVVAQDSSGKIILIVTPLIGLKLLDLSAYLPNADMSLVNALNLDGGGSTLMYLNSSGEPEYVVTSLDPVPAILAIYPR